MILQTIAILGAMLLILMLLSTLGGSMNVMEHFDDGDAADKGSEGGGISGEILRSSGGEASEASEASREGAGSHPKAKPEGAESHPKAKPEGAGSQPKAKPEDAVSTGGGDESARGDIEPFDGDMYAAYN